LTTLLVCPTIRPITPPSQRETNRVRGRQVRPIVSTGKWLSGKFSSINIFVFFFDFIIEAPFKIFVTVAEEWGKYLNERRENLN
jgi:hypothetical protein